MSTVMLVLGLALCLLGATTAGADVGGRPDDDQNKTVDLQILSFNDYHGWLETPGGSDATLGSALDPGNNLVGGGSYLATTLANLRTGKPNSLTVTAGDLIGGTPFLSGLFHDEPSVESLEAMHLDVSSVGNHEFDEGLTELLRMQKGGCHPVDGCYFPQAPYDGANFPWLAANVFYGSSKRNVLPATWVKKVQGVKVGFIGMTLEDTPVLVAQSGIQGVQFRDEVASAKRAVRKLKEDDVETVVVLLHEGGLQTGTYQDCAGISGPIVDIAKNLDPEIDLVVTGHTHQPYVCDIPDPNGKSRKVTSASSFGRVVTETNLVINRESGEVIRDQVTTANHLVLRTVTPDPTQQTILAKWQAAAAPIANRVIGQVNGPITRSANRNTESALANLIADAQLAATSAPGNGGAQIALMNPGGVRADLANGPATYGKLFDVQPFGNTLVTMNLTGQQVHDVLEQQAVPGRAGGRDILILGVSNGLQFEYFAGNAFGDRVPVATITLNGVAIDPAATYRVTVNSFLADGGDAFTTLKLGTNRLGGGDDLAALVSYVAANSPVSAPPTDRILEG
jgi:2',3'-cyclic-nucleotide 2'-phosphodiesterase (5'-nucleotidase family)